MNTTVYTSIFWNGKIRIEKDMEPILCQFKWEETESELWTEVYTAQFTTKYAMPSIGEAIKAIKNKGVKRLGKWLYNPDCGSYELQALYELNTETGSEFMDKERRLSAVFQSDRVESYLENPRTGDSGLRSIFAIKGDDYPEIKFLNMEFTGFRTNICSCLGNDDAPDDCDMCDRDSKFGIVKAVKKQVGLNVKYVGIIEVPQNNTIVSIMPWSDAVKKS